MDLGSFFLIFALFVLAGLFVAHPFNEHKLPGEKAARWVQGHDISALLAEHDQIINALRELDFDFAMKKIPEADYPVQRNILLNRGAEILRQLDGYQKRSPGTKGKGGKEPVKTGKSSKVEITRPAPQPSQPTPDDELETKIAARRRNRQEKSGGFCPQCGKPVQVSDHFCPKCGESLESR